MLRAPRIWAAGRCALRIRTLQQGASICVGWWLPNMLRTLLDVAYMCKRRKRVPENHDSFPAQRAEGGGVRGWGNAVHLPIRDVHQTGIY